MNRRSIFNEKEAVRAHTGDEEGASTSSCPGATQVVPRTARDIPDPSCARAQRRQMSVKAHKTTGAQTTEPGHHNGEFVNDVQVSPIDEGVGVVEEDELSRAARRPRTGASGSLPRSRQQDEVGVVIVGGSPSGRTVGPLRTQKKPPCVGSRSVTA